MHTSHLTEQTLLAEIAGLHARLAAAEKTLSAIRGDKAKPPAITGRKRNEEVPCEATARLHASDHLLAEIVHGMTEACFALDREWRFTFVNNRCRALFHHHHEEMLGRTIWEVFHQLVGTPIERHYRRAMARRKPVSFEAFSPILKRWLDVRLSPSGDGLAAFIVDIHSRKMAEQALRESDERYRQLIHGLPAAVYTCNAKGRITLYNAAAVKLWGREPKLGRDRWSGALRLFTPDGKRIPLTRSAMALAVSRDQPIRNMEQIIERPDGSRSHVLAFPDPIHDSSGVVTGAVNMLVDITALKVAENALRNSERTRRMLSLAVEQNPTSVLITTTTGEIVYVNPKFTELTGYSLDEVLGQNPRLLKSGHHTTAFYQRLWGTIMAGHEWRGELCNRKKNGELYWEYAVIAPILNDQGAIAHLVALKEDITERKRTVAALRESERRERERAADLMALLDAVPTAVFIAHDPDCRFVTGNRAADELLRAAEENRPRQFKGVKNDRELSDDELPIQRAARGIPVHDFEFTLVFDDGSARDVLSYGTTLRDEAGRPRGAVSVLVDITERKRLEREILEISECEQSRLGQDLHDGLGQELTGIAMLCKVLADKLRTECHPSAETAANIATHVSDAIGSARRLARGLYPVELSCYGLFVALKELAGQTSQRLGIRCELRQSGQAPTFNESIGIHIYRIVQEGIANAIKHGHARQIVIESLEADGFHTFHVTDDGIGFERPAEHSGMGLHLMEYRARVIGAELNVEKPAQGGCRITCRLPTPC